MLTLQEGALFRWKSPMGSNPPAPLYIFYSHFLREIMAMVIAAKGGRTRPFQFPLPSTGLRSLSWYLSIQVLLRRLFLGTSIRSFVAL